MPCRGDCHWHQMQPVYQSRTSHGKLPLGLAQMIKYGVISLAALERDLQQWDTLYCAGRLHKPVMTLRVCKGLGTGHGQAPVAVLMRGNRQ